MPENKQAANKTGLTFSEKKRLVELRRILAGNGKEQAKPDTAQKTITFKKMFRDGICQVTHNFYTKMVEFYDINYDLLEVEDQGDILEEYSKLINYFDPSIKFELFLFNRQVNEQALAEQFDISLQDDDFDDIREEYTQMLKHQSAKGNNGIIKSKYLIFGVESTGYKEAKNKLNNIEKDVIRNLNNIGTNARSLDGKERLRILHEYFNQGTMEPFRFSFKELSESGKSVKDYIAPPGFDFRYPSRFKSGSMYGSVHYLDIIAPRFNDELLKKLLDIDDNLTITMHMQTMDPVKAIKMLKGALTNIQKMKIEEQKKAVRSGYDMDILPTDIITYEKDTLELLDDLNTSNQKIVKMTFLITCYGKTKRELGMLIVQDAVWNRVSQNRERKIATRYYCDEFHLLLKEKQTAIYSVEIWKRFRKWGGIPTGLTQNVGDFLRSEEIEGILGNSDFVYLLNQNAKDQAILADKLGLSEKQLSHVTNSEPGSGLILFDNVVIPFVDKYPTNTKTYAIMNTKPEEAVKKDEAS